MVSSGDPLACARTIARLNCPAKLAIFRKRMYDSGQTGIFMVTVVAVQGVGRCARGSSQARTGGRELFLEGFCR